jgi:hypothetical protein
MSTRAFYFIRNWFVSRVAQILLQLLCKLMVNCISQGVSSDISSSVVAVSSPLTSDEHDIPVFLLFLIWSSSVSIVSDYGLDDRGSIPGRDKEFFL